jgi:hypothetical protein
MKNSTELKICNTFTEEFTEKQTQEVKLIKDLFEGSIDIIPSIIEPVIREDKQKDFKSAYAYVMQTYKPYHNIKPCIANVLINGLSDGWRVNSPGIAFECLRVFDFDLSKAWELMKLYYENSRKKKRRTLAHLRGALKWIYLHRDFKLKCERLSREIPCIGSKEICYNIRGIHKTKAKGGFNNMELLENQKALYLKRFIDYGYNLRLSKRAVDIYFFLLQRYFELGFDTLFISYRELAKGIDIKDGGGCAIAPYLKELKRENLIAYTPGKPGRSKIASEIKVLDITGRKENRAEALFKELFKN